MTKDAVATYTGFNGGRSQTESNQIRSHARKSALSSPVPQKCVVCGYDIHVEVCHIRPVCSFHPKTAAHVINADDNLTYLCPNCHWEMDHGISPLAPSLKDIMRKPMPNLAKVLKKRAK
jgi:hypothetical protein